MDNQDLIVYPNPATNELRISISTGSMTNAGFKIQSIHIYNVLGEMVYTSYLSTNQSTINISQLSKGIYFVEVQSENTIINRKLIKE